jgi:alkanesulfonate monooxygenase SsuD/methylene tetrahydromethanopterin reductase-like flavin-dependent oxidoreductase (luciferase family)
MPNTILFGANIDPSVNKLELAYQIARLADERGLDMVMSQDHPYNKDHLDTWTLISAIAARTQRVHIGTNVANLPLRTPALLAKQAASLDVMSGGRLELGIGAGAFWKGIIAYGANPDLEDKPFTAFRESLDIIQGMWANSMRSFSHEGEFYRMKGAIPGPAPAHPIRVWVGGYGPRMLRLIGARADGVTVSTSYAPYRQLKELNAHIRQGAEEAGRDPAEVRRMYNLMGVITEQDTSSGFEGKSYQGSVQQWIDHLTMLHREYEQDTFVYWPVEGDPLEQMEIFATEIAPTLRTAAV